MAAAGKGFSRMHCPAHFDRFNRHGSFWLGAIPGGLLAPLRRAAERWIEKECLAGIELAGIAALMNTAGVDPLNTYSLRGLDTRQKALNTLAHLHRLGVPPSRILAVQLAVLFVVEHAASIDRGADYRRTQVGKTLARLIPATTTTFANGRTAKKHFPSRGLSLGVLGEMIEEASGARHGTSTTFASHVARLIEPPRHRALKRAVDYLKCPTTNVREKRPDGSVIYRLAKLDMVTGKPLVDDPWRDWFAFRPGDRARAAKRAGSPR